MSEEIREAIAIQQRLKRMTYKRNGRCYSRELRKAINKNIARLLECRKERKS